MEETRVQQPRVDDVDILRGDSCDATYSTDTDNVTLYPMSYHNLDILVTISTKLFKKVNKDQRQILYFHTGVVEGSDCPGATSTTLYLYILLGNIITSRRYYNTPGSRAWENGEAIEKGVPYQLRILSRIGTRLWDTFYRAMCN